MLKLAGVPPSQLISAPPRLKPVDLVTITSTAPVVAVWLPEDGGAYTATTTPLLPLVRPLRCASYWAALVMVAVLLATRSTEPAIAAASAAPCIWRFTR